MNKEHLLRVALPVAAVIASVGVGFAGVTSAQSIMPTEGGAPHIRMMGMQGERPAVVGKVTAVSGSTITVESKAKGTDTAATYTVDASAAKILKGEKGVAPTESTVSAIAVGDMVAVRGTVSGTSVTATEVMTGMMFGGPHGEKRGPGVAGTVTAVNGTSITITGKDGTTYTIDGSTATVGKMTTITVGDIKVGDEIGVHGERSGTSVKAVHIMDGMPPMPQQ